MNILKPGAVRDVVTLFSMEIGKESMRNTQLDFDSVRELALSHENLRALVKDLLAQLLIQECDNKSLLEAAQNAVIE